MAKDVCEALDLRNPTMATQRLDNDERSKFNLGRQGEVIIVNESGLYSLILQSRKPEAKAFKHWITHEVLSVSWEVMREIVAAPRDMIASEVFFWTEFIANTGLYLPIQGTKLSVVSKKPDGATRSRGGSRGATVLPQRGPSCFVRGPWRKGER